ncbi:MAG: RNA polymerase sigma factor [Pseudomonadota bacterium]|uniref:RNA polymerase sigma factor n=1 Tax=Roseovarius TaxID=74030 RepID=UPI0022A7CA45|nr:RNA polymerase sigma factor [Roseovarius sp. EGI FJ00037]MCZ0811776.1 RNA polymerase sigma factor [Roseovarius sp. EGI FJ00037]
MPLDAMNDISDDALLVLFANGDRAAARALTLRLTPRVLAHAQRLLGSPAEAEDVAQEAMLRLWKVAPEWRQGEAKVTTWLYRVVANLCTDRLRKGHSLPLEAAPEPIDTSRGPAAALQGAARAEALQRALGGLPERQRQAVVLRHLEDMGNPEIAGIMDISVEAVESLLARGRRALAAELAGQRAELGFVDEQD